MAASASQLYQQEKFNRSRMQPSIAKQFSRSSVSKDRRPRPQTKKKRSRTAATDADGDRISQLPDVIIHDILYRLNSPKTAATTSMLSRRWLHAWRSYPVLEFRDSEFGSLYAFSLKENFRRFAASSSRRLRSSRSSDGTSPTTAVPLEAVRLSFGNPNHVERLEFLHIHEFQNASPMEFELTASVEFETFSQRPRNPFPWNFSRTKSLKLTRFDFQSLKLFNNICSMNNLEILYLDSVAISEQDLCTVLRNAPNLETLSMIRVDELESIEFSSDLVPNLKSLRIGAVQPLAIHLASAPLLHTLDFQPELEFRLTVESPLSSAPNLKVLKVHNLCKSWTQSDFDHLMNFCFPSVVSLSFDILEDRDRILPSFGINGLWISNRNLRELRLSNWPSYYGVRIDAPNLVRLHYATDRSWMPRSSIIDLVNVASNCECVIVVPHGYQTWLTCKWFVELKNFIATLARSHPRPNLVLKLQRLHNCERVVFDSSRATCNLPPLAVRHLELDTNVQSVFSLFMRDGHLLDGLFWVGHPTFLSLTQPNYGGFLFSYICEQLLKKDDVPAVCCSDFKCWRHQLKEVKVKGGNGDEMIEISRSLISSIVKQNKVTFMLTWS